MRDVGRRVAELRHRRGWTQAILAEKLDIAIQNAQRIEQGRQNLTIGSLTKIAGVLGCPVRELFDAPATREAPELGRPRAVRHGAGVSRSRRTKRS